MLSAAVRLYRVPRRFSLRGLRVARGPAPEVAGPSRRALHICLGLVWLLDAGLQFQPYMFGPFFVTQQIQPAITGNPAAIAGPATWASRVMLHHIAVYNGLFAAIQLLIAAGILCHRTVKPALAASIVWALCVWWFGEGLGGIFTGSSPLAGFPGGVVLYALIAVLLWPSGRSRTSAATSGPLGAWAAQGLWLVLWGSCSYFLLLPGNRAPGTIAGLLSFTDGQPGWIAWLMNSMSSLAGQRDAEISLVLAAACVFAAGGIFAKQTIRPALAVAAALGLVFWLAEGLGGIFTGQGTDPSTGPLLVLLAACFWPGRTLLDRRSGPAVRRARLPHAERDQCDPGQRDQRPEHRPERRAGHEAAADNTHALQREDYPGQRRDQADSNERAVLHE
jgi:hypothetical protein